MAEVEAFDQFAIAVSRDTWSTFRRDPVLFLIAGLVLTLVAVLTLGILAGPLHIAYLDMVRRVRAGETVAVSDLFSRMDAFISSSVALSLFVVLMLIGFCMLVLPGFVVIVAFTWAMPAIAFDRMGGVESLRYSWSLVRAHTMHAIALLFGLIVLQVLGNLLVVGFVLAIPLGTIATAIAYERVRALPVLDLAAA